MPQPSGGTGEVKKSIKTLMPIFLERIDLLDSLDVSIDIAPECEDTWTHDYAICRFSFAPMGHYFAEDAFLEDVQNIGTEIFGRSAQWFSCHKHDDEHRKAHKGIVMVIYQQEIEIYRNRIYPRPSKVRARSIPVTDPDHDAPDGATVDGWTRVGDAWWKGGNSLPADAFRVLQSGKSER